MTRTRSGDAIQATGTSLEVVEIIEHLDGARTTEVAAELGVAKSTAHKHLKTLERRGYLAEEGGEYRVGLKFLHLGESARTRWPFYDLVREAVTALGERTDEDVDFCVEEHARVYTLCEAYHKWEKYSESKAGYRVNTGDWYPMHAVASGKAILATYDEASVREVIDRWGLPALTDETITDVDELLVDLERTRERGYGLSDEEYVDGLRTVSRTVSLPDGRVLGALSVSGPAYRMAGAVLEQEIPDALAASVESLEEQLAAADPAVRSRGD